MRSLFNLAIISSSLVLSACQNPSTGIEELPNNDFSKILKRAGYQIMIMPSGLESAGALVLLSDDGDPQWIGDLESCGFEDVRRVESSFPDFSGKGTLDFGVNALANFMTVANAEANVGTVRKSKLAVNGAGREVIDYYALSAIYLNKEKRELLNQECLSDIKTGRVRLIGDAAFVDSGEFEFFKDDGFSVKLTAKEIIENLEFNAGFEVKSGADASMSIDERIFVGFREARKFPEPGNNGPDGRPLWDDATSEVNAAFDLE